VRHGRRLSHCLDVVRELRPALEAVLAGDGELRVREDGLGGVRLVRTNARLRRCITAAQGVQEILRLFSELRERRTVGEPRDRGISHDDLLSTTARVRTTSLKEDRNCGRRRSGGLSPSRGQDAS
jgi:hypothetical protein